MITDGPRCPGDDMPRIPFMVSGLVAVAITCGVMLPVTTSAENRIALVIGNGAYRSVPTLPNPPNDAGDVASSLGRLGFNVQRVTDAGYDAMRRALLDFDRKAHRAEIAIVFYAGHGMEVGGENWLIPIDAELKTDRDAEHEAIALKGVLSTVDCAAKLGLVILDACRDNPFAAKMQRTIRTRAVSRGLAQASVSGNVLVAYAAKDGTTAADGQGRNSPFTTALLKHIETPGLEVNFLFRRVRDDVMTTTRREQQPFVYGSLSQEEIYLHAAPSRVAATPPTAQPPSLPTPAPGPTPETQVAAAPPTTPIEIDRLGRVWNEEEIGGWRGLWTRRSRSSVFDAAWQHPNGARETAVLDIKIAGNRVSIQRQQSKGRCSYEGTLTDDGRTVRGTYGCAWARGPFQWRATIGQ
ncbi:MAG: caspase family protein [Rhizobiales bacterium]|nr:caspase family protein [Hyphomicrobiales bacterium]